jgi:hypothetical protein
MAEAEIQIPKKGKAGVVVNEGPDFHIEVQEVDVPEPGESYDLSRNLSVCRKSDGALQPTINYFSN